MDSDHPNSQLFCLCLPYDLLLPNQEVMQMKYVMMLSKVPVDDAPTPIPLSDIGPSTRVEVVDDDLGFWQGAEVRDSQPGGRSSTTALVLQDSPEVQKNHCI